MSVLEQIVASTRKRLDFDGSDLSLLRQQATDTRTNRSARAFSAALRGKDGTAIIAEIKAASPSGGEILRNPDVSRIAAGYSRAGAAAISVVTERDHFNGNPAWIEVARRSSSLPVLMKEFVIDERQIFRGAADGADAVLLLVSILDQTQIGSFLSLIESLGMDALVEIHDDEELEMALAAGASLIGINNRNLKDFSVSLSTGERLVSRIPERVLRIAESGIRSRADIERLTRAGFDGFLVGTSLLSSGDPERALLELTGVRVG